MRALITGVNGQDGSYMAEFLLSKGYEVFGTVRRSSTQNLDRLKSVLGKIELLYADLSDQCSIDASVDYCEPDEIYNLGAMSFVPNSWNQPTHTFDVNCIGLLRLIQASKQYDSKIYQASTSEMFGNSYPHFAPLSPYGISKLAAHHLADAYRKRGRFISCGVCFNHESPRRGNEFVTQKIANYFKNPRGKLKLGNLDACRDWGFAGDYVEAMWIMLQQPDPDDYEVATGETHSIKEFLDIALPDWKDCVEIDSDLIRNNEINVLKGDPTRIKKLGWAPKIGFKELVEMMCRE